MASESESTGRNGSQNSSYVPLSHPFVERLIGTIRRELLDHVLFWTAADLESKLSAFQTDRKSTRLNSSHSQISYAVFCLKKKKKKESEAISHRPLRSS